LEQRQGEAAARAVAVPAAREGLWTRHFTLVCLAQLLNYCNNMPLYVAFPVYLTGLGHSTEMVGIAMAAFSTVSFLVRPLVGAGVDRLSAKWVFVGGALALALASGSYLLPALAVLLVGRMIHGVGWAAINTAGGVLAAEASPPTRRGEGLGYFSMMPSIASTIMPAFGLWLIATAGEPTLFMLSAVLGLIGAALALALREPPRSARPRPAGGLWRSMVERGSLLPAGILTTVATAQPAVTTYLVLVAQDRGLENVPLLFVATGLAMVGAQFLSWLSDVLGRAPVIALSIGLNLLGVPVMMVAHDGVLLTLGAVIMAAGGALAYPALMALAIDRTPPANRGAAMATFTAAFQVGNGLGAILLGFAIARWGYDGMFLTTIAVLLVGVVVLALNWQAAGSRRLGPAA
jgi:MFS family permease